MFVYGAILFITLGVVRADLPKCVAGKYQIIPKLDCTGYYLCVFGKPVEMPDCPPGSAFSTSAHVCVPKDSIYDDCKLDVMPTVPDLGPLSIAEQCHVKGGLIPHPDECQAYYNCSHWYESVPRHFEQHLQECPYPQLFSSETGKCEHFEDVKCGERKVFKNGCNYRRNQCPVAHCVPCSVRLPSCEGKPDGIHAHEVKLWSPYFVDCYKERTISERICKPDEQGRTQIFNPELNECVSMDQIPRAHGGMMPDCTNLADGFYLDEFGRCDRYTVCRGGKFSNFVKCQPGETFDAFHDVCMPEKKTCGPCGNRSDC